MEKKKLKDVKCGEFFTLTKIEEPKEKDVYVLGEYDRTYKEYSAYKFSDMNFEKFLKGSKEVWVGFTF